MKNGALIQHCKSVLLLHHVLCNNRSGLQVTDVMFFVCILLVFMVSYGTVSQALRYPNSPLSWSLLRDVISYPFWFVLGQFNQEEMEGNGDKPDRYIHCKCVYIYILHIRSVLTYMFLSFSFTHAHSYTHAHIRTHAHTHMHACTNACTLTVTHACAHACTCQNKINMQAHPKPKHLHCLHLASLQATWVSALAILRCLQLATGCQGVLRRRGSWCPSAAPTSSSPTSSFSTCSSQCLGRF